MTTSIFVISRSTCEWTSFWTLTHYSGTYLDDPKLSNKARTLAADPANRGFVSPATHWEIAIKIGTGKYSLKVPFAQFIQEAIHDNGFSILPIEPRHTEQVISLPKLHNDPFDRLLIAQAIVEKMPIVSIDSRSRDFGSGGAPDRPNPQTLHFSAVCAQSQQMRLTFPDRRA